MVVRFKKREKQSEISQPDPDMSPYIFRLDESSAIMQSCMKKLKYDAD